MTTPQTGNAEGVASSELLEDARKIDAALGRAAVALDDARLALKRIRGIRSQKRLAKFRARVAELKSKTITVGVGFENFIEAESSNDQDQLRAKPVS